MTSPETLPQNPPKAGLGGFLQLIRFSHTIFALPFALVSMLVAANGFPAWRVVLGVILAMVSARTAAMLFNRLVDWEIDRKNPRTANRHQLFPKPLARLCLIASSLVFVGAAAWLNPLCLVLSPLALAIVFFYSLTKRFTHAAQIFLGLALSVAPVGAWLAVTGSFAIPPLVLALGVLLWVAGFDLIYATQDYEFDKKTGLKSGVVALGIPGALRAALLCHAGMVVCMLAFGFTANLGLVYYLFIPVLIAALFWEHRVAASGDIAKINQAFFTANAWVSALCLLFVALDQIFVTQLS